MSEFVIEIKRADSGGDTFLRLYDLQEPGIDKAANTLTGVAVEPLVPKDILARNQKEIETAGLVLHNWLASALNPALDYALNDDTTIHRFYLDIQNTELQARPWEILRWLKPTLGGGVPQWVRQAHHLSRVHQPVWTMQPPPSGPVRVLAIVGSEDNSTAVEPLAELAEIRRGIQPVHRTVDFAVISRPKDLGALYKEIIRYRPHVLHFIGHGRPDALVIEAAHGWDWTSGQLVDLGKEVVKKWRPRMVFLNACRTGISASELASIAGAFIGNGAVATIAMQGDIKGEAAGRLSATFYREVARGRPIDEALTTARSQVSAEFAHREAAYPALTLRCHPSNVLPTIKREEDLRDYQARLRYCPFLKEKMRAFVDQVEPRRKLCDSTWPQSEGEGPFPLLVLTGDSGYGKSLLSAWLLDLSLRVGRQARYVQVRPETGGGVDTAELLRRIWGSPERTIGSTSPLMCRLDLDPDGRLKLAEAIDHNKDLNNNPKDPAGLFEKFRTALRQAAATAPITIVLDEFGMSVPAGIFRLLWMELLVYLGTEELPGVTMVLALTKEEYKEYVNQKGLPLAAMIEVPLTPLQVPDFIAAFGDYVTYGSEKPNPNAGAYIRMATDNADKWGSLSIDKIEARVKKMDEAAV